MKRIVVGVFQNQDSAWTVVKDLTALGVPADEVSVISRYTNKLPDDSTPQETDVVKDAKTGAVIGGLTGLLIALSPIVVPGIGLALVGGGLLATLAGATLGGITGSFVGALTDLGLHSQVAHRYAHEVNRGGTLVFVRTHLEDEAQIVKLMERDGAVEVNERDIEMA